MIAQTQIAAAAQGHRAEAAGEQSSRAQAAFGAGAGRERVAGRLSRIHGAVVEAELSAEVALGEVALIGAPRLAGEVIALEGSIAVAQVYEPTDGLAPGEPFVATGEPLSCELGPGLLGGVFDGIQRPLDRLAAQHGDFLLRGARAPALDRDRLWDFTPRVEVGQRVGPGEVLGVVPETAALQHRVLVPPGVSGTLVRVSPPGPRRVADEAAAVRTADGRELSLPLFHRWRVRAARPYGERLPPALPMITGQRVLDTFFPLPLGGSAGLPGGFGTGKTILQHQLCKWCDADVIVFVGCGERGNEMTHMLRELPELVDPRSGRPLHERTVLVANTSNMPVSARESSIYTGVTIAEYFRDQGLRVAMLADSTSRWGEALRDISGRLGEIPAEEGYPPYLSSRLAAFYERAGRVRTLAGDEGSVTLISAISPPGGDLAEPVTRHTQEYARTFWTLDKELAAARFFPALSVSASYGDVPEELRQFWDAQGGGGWSELRTRALALLAEARRLQGTARLLGAESLPEKQRFVLGAAAIVEEGFLQQNAFDDREARDEPERQVCLLRALLHFHQRGLLAVEAGVGERALLSCEVVPRLQRARWETAGKGAGAIEALIEQVDQQCAALERAARARAAGGA